MAISFVAQTNFNSLTDGSSVVADCPAGVVSGDLLVMVVGLYEITGANVTSTGWTRVDAYANDIEDAAAVLTKVAGASEPATYTVNFGASATARIGGIAAYRGAVGLAAEAGSNEQGVSPPLSTPSVANGDANNWRIVFGYAAGGSSNGNPSVNDGARRFGGTAWTDVKPGTSYWGVIQFYDSNAAIGSTSSQTRTFTTTGSAPWWAYAWIGILDEGGGTPVTGPIGVTLKNITGDGDGVVTDNGTMAMTLSSVTQGFLGFGTPPNVDGTASMPLQGVSINASGAIPVSGTMGMLIPVVFALGTETRSGGNRVIVVEADTSRRIIVQSRGVDD